MMFGIYISEKINFNFKFTWEEHDLNEGDDGKNFFGLQKKFIGPSVGKKEEIFSKNFIKKYYIDNIPKNHGFYLHSTNKTFQMIINGPFETEWGYYSPGIEGGLPSKWILYCNEIECLIELSNIYKRIEFSSRMQFVIYQAKLAFEKFSNQFVALHIRGADIVFRDFYKNWSLADFVGDKYFPYEIAFEIIEREIKTQNHIIIFGQDEKNNTKLLKYFKQKYSNLSNKFHLISDFINCDLSIFERSFFEMNFMSYALKIYTPGIQEQKSAFSQCAMIIAGRKNIISYHEIFSLLSQYKIIKKNIDFLDLDPEYKSMAYFRLYQLSRQLNFSIKHSIKFLNFAMEYDKRNYSLIIHLLDCYFQQNNFDFIENYLSKMSNKDFNHFLSIFIISGSMRIYREQEINYMRFNNKNYPMINLIAIWLNYQYGEFITVFKLMQSNNKLTIYNLNNFYFNSMEEHVNFIEKSATLMVKNHLNYKIGRIFLEYNFVSNFFRLLQALKYCIINHGREQKIFKLKKNDIVKLPDYKASLKIYNYKSYKLGKIIINGVKNWYRGGIFIMIFNLCLFLKNNKKVYR
ncbi:hypothetical protein [Campylobacter jejuni]|nr:hypothetical protein [Campylobacter jejuni]